MKIRIYQINSKRDKNKVCFAGFNTLERLQGNSEVDSAIYDEVFAGEVGCKSIESVYKMFNNNIPAGIKMRSVSVSDVIEIFDDNDESKFYYVDSIGFKKINFDSRVCNSELADKNKTISVLLVEPNKHPKIIELEDSLEAMQKIVGGYIEQYSPFNDDVAIICNDEGKLMGMPLNRAICSDSGDIIDIIAGNFFVCYAPFESENFCSLSDELAKKYMDMFWLPETFVNVNGDIVVIPLTNDKLS